MLPGNKYVAGINDFIGRNFIKSKARVVLEVSERTSDFRHLIDSWTTQLVEQLQHSNVNKAFST